MEEAMTLRLTFYSCIRRARAVIRFWPAPVVVKIRAGD